MKSLDVITNTLYAIEDVPAPIKTPKPVKQKRVKPKIKVSESLKEAAEEYKKAYKSVYGIKPVLTYDGTWVRLQGQKEGINLRRLRELTTQLKHRAG